MKNQLKNQVTKSLIILGILLAFPTNNYAQLPTNGLVGYWPADGNALDASGNGHDGLPVGSGTVTYAAGAFGQAFQLDGSSGFDVPDAPDLRIDNYSLSAWFNSQGLQSIPYLIAKGPHTYKTYSLGVYGSDAIINYAQTQSGQAVAYLYSPGLITNNQWYHVVGTYDGTTSKLYIDGVEVASEIKASNNLLHSSDPVSLGYYVDGGQTFNGFIGLLDDMALYSRTLTSAEISQIFASYNPGSPNTAPTADAGMDQTVQAMDAIESVTLDGSASSDADGDLLTYSWVLNGTIVSTSVSFSTNLSAGSSYTFTLTVDDIVSGSSSDDVVITVLEPPNIAPTFTSTPVTSIFDNEPYNYTVTTNDDNGDAVVVSASQLPSWLTLTAGTGAVSTLTSGGQGYLDGPVATAQFNNPSDAVVDASGNVYIADTGNNCIRKITPGGLVSTFAGSSSGYVDGPGSSAQFAGPIALDIDASGNLYVADQNNQKIRKITPGGFVSTLATVSSPQGVAVAPSGIVYASAYVAIMQIDLNGTVTTLAGGAYPSFADGQGTSALFNGVFHIDTDAAGNIYAADPGNKRIRKITPQGLVTTYAGTGAYGAQNGPAATATFYIPQGVHVDVAGNVFVGDTGNKLIRKISTSGVVTTVAGNGTATDVDGTLLNASFAFVRGLGLDAGGNLYVPSVTSGLIRKVSPAGTSLAGDPAGQVGTHPVTLVADDGNGGSASQVFTITVNASNVAPVAAAGTDQSIDCAVGNVDVTLDGSASSDPDGDPLTYSWSDGTSEVSAAASFSILVNAGTHTFTLTVEDGNGGTASDDVVVTVNADTTAPVLTLTGDNPIQTICHFGYTDPGVTAEDNCDNNPTVVMDTSLVDTLTVGSYIVTYTATDASGNSASVERTVEVINNAPVVDNAVGGITLEFGGVLTTTVDLSAVFSDPDGHAITYTAANSDAAFASSTLTGYSLTLDAVDIGTSNITVTTTDVCGASVTDVFTVDVGVVEDLAQTVVFAFNHAELKKEVDVSSGNIMVNNINNNDGDDDDEEDDEEEDDEEFELKVDKKVSIASGFAVKANNIQIKKDSEIDSDVYYNGLDNDGDINGNEYSPLSIPLFSSLPPFKSAPAGSQDITVDKNQTVDLAPGDYGKIKVKDNGTLTFSAGVYNIQKIELKKKAKLRMDGDGTIEVRAEESMKTGKEAYIGPANGSLIQPSDIIFYIAGTGDDDDDDENEVKFGKKGSVFATVYAPNSKIEVEEKTDITGALYASEVKVDKEANLTLDSFFDLSGSGSSTKQMAWSSEPEFEVVPTDFALNQNYPNPFNPSTTFNYGLKEDSDVVLEVYTLLGQKVMTLVNEKQPAGYHKLQIDMSGLSSGVYLYRLQAGTFVKNKKFILLK